MDYPKISIVTPNLNTEAFIERTILSVLQQDYPNLEYIIIDGGSTDNSVSIIKRYQSRLKLWLSEHDRGLYAALNKGFRLTSGQIMGYLNSDDMLHPGALHNIARLFMKHPSIHWIQGYPTVFDEDDKMVSTRPPRHSAMFFYARRHNHSTEFIQQESTYWTRSLWDKAGGQFDEGLKLAGDFDLWLRFFRHERLHVTRQFIGGFRVRRNQLSSNLSTYLQECEHALQCDAASYSTPKRAQIFAYKALYSLLPGLVNKVERLRLARSYLEP